ncbi:hypothetical protein [uncultured marine virus]|uniref:ATP-dependent helicase Rep n=1 Tax=uncultured marine virus TaxID=186617 RepID=S4TF49_9VIRU|nr:hypothetical protein [uncultured marine virus]
MKKQSRNFTFTLNNYTQEHLTTLEILVEQKAVKGIFYGKEVGESGTPHLQGFICFTTTKSMKQCIKAIPGAHVEFMKGTIEQNVAYCSKDNDFVTLGTLPMTQKKKGEAEKERWEEALAAAKEGRFDDIPADIQFRYDRNIKRIYAENKPKPQTLNKLTNEWYCGPSGTGKSKQARDKYPDAYVKLNNKWWDGYADEETVIIDDFDKYDIALSGHLKRWSDHYPFPAEFKGGVKVIRPKRIIITSNYTPEEIWEEEATLGPIRRRFHITQFKQLKQHHK